MDISFINDYLNSNFQFYIDTNNNMNLIYFVKYCNNKPLQLRPSYDYQDPNIGPIKFIVNNNRICIAEAKNYKFIYINNNWIENTYENRTKYLYFIQANRFHVRIYIKKQKSDSYYQLVTQFPYEDLVIGDRVTYKKENDEDIFILTNQYDPKHYYINKYYKEGSTSVRTWIDSTYDSNTHENETIRPTNTATDRQLNNADVPHTTTPGQTINPKDRETTAPQITSGSIADNDSSKQPEASGMPGNNDQKPSLTKADNNTDTVKLNSAPIAASQTLVKEQRSHDNDQTKTLAEKLDEILGQLNSLSLENEEPAISANALQNDALDALNNCDGSFSLEKDADTKLSELENKQSQSDKNIRILYSALQSLINISKQLDIQNEKLRKQLDSIQSDYTTKLSTLVSSEQLESYSKKADVDKLQKQLTTLADKAVVVSVRKQLDELKAKIGNLDGKESISASIFNKMPGWLQNNFPNFGELATQDDLSKFYSKETIESKLNKFKENLKQETIEPLQKSLDEHSEKINKNTTSLESLQRQTDDQKKQVEHRLKEHTENISTINKSLKLQQEQIDIQKEDLKKQTARQLQQTSKEIEDKLEIAKLNREASERLLQTYFSSEGKAEREALFIDPKPLEVFRNMLKGFIELKDYQDNLQERTQEEAKNIFAYLDSIFEKSKAVEAYTECLNETFLYAIIKENYEERFKKNVISFLDKTLTFFKNNNEFYDLYQFFTAPGGQGRELCKNIGCIIFTPQENETFDRDTMEVFNINNTENPERINKVCRCEDYGLIWQTNSKAEREIIKRAKVVIYR